MHSRFILDCSYMKDKVHHVTLADGLTRAVPVACVELRWGSHVMEENVGVMTALPKVVLLGNDLAGPEAPSYVCVTRQQKRRQEAEEKSTIRSMKISKLKPNHIDVTTESDATTGSVLKENEETPVQGPSMSTDNYNAIETGVKKTTED